MTKKKLILDFIAQRRWLFLITIFFGIISSLLTILIPVSIGKYYDLLFDFNSKRSAILNYFPESWQNDIPAFLTFFLVMVLLRIVFNFNQRYWTNYLGERFTKEIREDLFEKQLRVEMNVYETSGISKYLLRYSGDLSSIRGFLTIGVVRFIIDIVLLCVALIALFLLNIHLTLIVLTGMLLALILVFFLNKLIYKVSLNHRNKKSGLLTFVNRTLLGISSVKAFNRHAIEKKRFNKKSTRIFKLGIKYQSLSSLVQTVVPGILYLSLAGVLFAAYYLKNNYEGLESNELLAFILILITVLPVLRRTLRVPTKWKVGSISISKLLKIYNLPEDKMNEKGKSYRFKRGTIILENIRLDDSKIQIQNLEIKGSEFTTIILQNDSDRSYLLKLLVGLEKAQKGKIFFDEQRMELLDIKSLRKQISISSINYNFIGKSVYEAISYSKSKEKRRKVQSILDDLQVGMDLKTKLEIDTYLDEGLSNLSLNHKVLMAFARCFLSEKPIVIIDGLSDYVDLPVYNNIIKILSKLKEEKKTVLLLDKKKNAAIEGMMNKTYEL